MAVAKFDWDTISIEYIQGYLEEDDNGETTHKFPTYQQLSDKYKVSISTIVAKSKQDDWIVRRDLYRTKIRSKLEHSRISELFSESTKFDATNLNVIKQIDKLIDIFLAKYRIMLDPETNEIMYSEEMPPISIKELDTLMALLEKKHKLTRSILGEPVNAETFQQELEELKNNKVMSESARQSKIAKLNKQMEARRAKDKELEQRKQLIKQQMQQISNMEGSANNEDQS